LKPATYTLIPALQMVDAVEHLAPQAVAVRRCFVRLVIAQPGMQAQQLLERPAQVEGQANGQAPAIVATDQATDQAEGDQQQQVADQGRMPVLVQLGILRIQRSTASTNLHAEADR